MRGVLYTCINNQGQHQCDNQLYGRVNIRLQCCGAPPEGGKTNNRTDKQHLAVTQMFVTLCAVREAAPSVPVCEGSDQFFLHVLAHSPQTSVTFLHKTLQNTSNYLLDNIKRHVWKCSSIGLEKVLILKVS